LNKNNRTNGDFKMKKQQIAIRLIGTTLLTSLVACTGAVKDARDPMENWNRDVQSFNEYADEYVMKPLATGYRTVMPSFADQGVTNVFGNIQDIGVTINDVLQFKLEQAGLDSSRFIVNSVAGVGGLVDVADMVGLEKHKEDFDQTLGVWGLPSEPYIVLPFFGPSSPRGIVGRVGDAAMNPANYVGFGVMGLSTGAAATAIGSGTNALVHLDKRADHLGAEKVVQEAAEDRYNFVKNSYFQQRDYLVNDGEGSNKIDVIDTAN
jgi:phospholipid-binding lipoprotein MlaA